MKKTFGRRRIAVFGSVRGLVISALLCGMSVVFGAILCVNVTESLRISLGNFPIILSGVAFGPLAGGIVGIGSDLLGCIIHGYSLNPLVTVGAGCVGIFAGLVALCAKGDRFRPIPLLIAVAAAHLAGSVIVKTAGLYWFYRTPLSVLIPSRVITYLLTAIAEYVILSLILGAAVIRRQLIGGNEV